MLIPSAILFAVANVQAAPPPPSPAPAVQESGSVVAVIYNKRVLESKDIAEYYAQRRQVPSGQVLGLALPPGETISRKDFSDDLEEPLFRWLTGRKLLTLNPRPRKGPDDPHYQVVLESRVRYLVLCYGMPLRVAQDPTLVEPGAEHLRAELKYNGAAVDSELALLPMLRQHVLRAGPLNNRLYAATNRAALDPTNGFLMVCRLDGPTPAIARQLVAKAMEAETNGLWGRAYVDARGLRSGEYKLGDDFMRLSAAACQRAGFDTVFDDKPETFPASFPVSHVAVYAGWYSSDACGPFAQPTVEFMPGAIAYHLHSTSAATLRTTTSHWVGPLLARGATVTLGCVNEPYLSGTPNIGVLLERMLDQQFSFGEAAYASQGVLSWQTTVVGDPLYRPFATPPDLLHYRLERRFSRLAEWSHQRLVNLNVLKGTSPAQLIDYLQSVPMTPTSAVLEEKMADLFLLRKDLSNAITAVAQALQDSPSPQQEARLLLHLGELHLAAGNTNAAYAAYQRFSTALPNHPALLDVLRKLEDLAAKLGRQNDLEQWKLEIWRRSPPPPQTSPAPTNAK